ncbi:UBC-like protein [Thozetella sp. PMI_491]|nr:UBC-like protein [Thozetella sp. PMI_491]
MSTASSASASRTATRRLLKEVESISKLQGNYETGIERIGPVSEDELFRWEAVINGQEVGNGYDEGRWLLRITIPPGYPQQPPKIEFMTPIVHANVALQTGEICLDLLKDAWSGTYTILECVRAVRMLLSCPGTDSPLNVDVAALLRNGDTLGARKLVELWVEEERYEGK